MQKENNISDIIKDIKFNRLIQQTRKLSDECRNLKTEAIKQQRFEDAAQFRDMEKTALDKIAITEKKLRKLKLGL